LNRYYLRGEKRKKWDILDVVPGKSTFSEIWKGEREKLLVRKTTLSGMPKKRGGGKEKKGEEVKSQRIGPKKAMHIPLPKKKKRR